MEHVSKTTFGRGRSRARRSSACQIGDCQFDTGTPATRFRQGRERSAGWVVGLAVAGSLLASACDSEFQPEIESELIVESTFVDYSAELATQGTVPILDGVANNLEWGSPDDPERPYTYVQLTSENGFGSPGVSRFIAVKASYTAEWDPIAGDDGLGAYRIRDVYFLLQWADLAPSQYKDSMIYAGPDLEAEEPRIRQRCQELLPKGTDNQIQRCVEDSLVTFMFDRDGEPLPEAWRQEGGDDMVMLFFGDGDATDADGRRFADFGTQMISDGQGGFGPLASGFIDAWRWSATRTNPQCETTKIADSGQDTKPVEGFSGYWEDYHIDASHPLEFDEGPCLWLPNFDPSLPVDQRVPLRVWIRRSDPNRTQSGVNKCALLNNGLDRPFLHRESVRSAVFSPDPDEPRVFNQLPFIWADFEPEQPTFWKPEHFVAGYLLGHDGRARCSIDDFEACFPACPGQSPGTDNFFPNCAGRNYEDPPHLLNTIQTRAVGGWNPVTRHWVVEALRPVTTPWGNTNTIGNEVEDHDFDDLLDRQRTFTMSIALWDDQDDGGAYWGSQPVKLVFNPPPSREERR